MSLSPVSSTRLTGSSVITRNEPVTKTATSENLNVVTNVLQQVSSVTPQVDVEKLRAAVASANEFLKPIASNLLFSIDDDSGRTIIKVVDVSTQEVLRQIPSPEMLAISKALGRFQGLFVEQKA